MAIAAGVGGLLLGFISSNGTIAFTSIAVISSKSLGVALRKLNLDGTVTSLWRALFIFR